MIAAIYARKSTDQSDRHEDAKSVTRQVEAGKESAATEGWAVTKAAHIYQDDNISGAEFDRPGLTRLLHDLSQKPVPFQWLVVMDESRLGRESWETLGILKRILEAGVRIWCYLDRREVIFKNIMEKMMLTFRAGFDEMERERARERTRDALERKAKAGHVCGGRVFGYRNVTVTENGKRSHVVREIVPEEAAVVRRIFELTVEGWTTREIVNVLSTDSAPTPVPRGGGRIRGWSYSAVRAVLRNPLYRGQEIWGRRQVRDQWGKKNPSERAPGEWVIVDTPYLRIVPDELWGPVQTLLTGRSTAHRVALGGRSPASVSAKYLLSGFGQCGGCGGGMIVVFRGRDHGRARYCCWTHRQRGRSKCANALSIPTALLDQAVLQAIEQEVLRPDVIEAATRAALASLAPADHPRILRAEMGKIQGEIANLTTAIAQGGEIPALLASLKEREERRAALRVHLDTATKVVPIDQQALKAKLRERLNDWQRLLRRHLPEARRVLTALLAERLVFTPGEDQRGTYYTFHGRGTVRALVNGIAGVSVGVRSGETSRGF